MKPRCPRIEIFMLKLDCGENFVMFGHSGHKLQRFEDLVFILYICMEFNAAVIMLSLQLNIKTVRLHRLNI